MTRVLFSVLLVFILAACQAAPGTAAVINATETLPPSETPLPPPTATQTLTPTIVPTPTVSPAQLKRRAGPVCENAFSVSVEAGPLTPPFAVMKKVAYTDAPSWELSHQLPHMGSLSAVDVRTVFCISETRAKTGPYTDGSAAYQLFWEVRTVSWPGGKVIGKNSFTGSPPPGTKVFSSGSAEGSYPYEEFAAWIFNQVEHPDFLYFNNAITTIAISPDGDIAAFGTAIANQIVDKDYQARIFLFNPSDLQTDLQTSSFLNVLDGHQGMVTSLTFSPDGKTLASSGYDLFIKSWDVATGGLLGQVSMLDTPNFLTFSPDGSKLAVASNLEVVFIDPASMQIEQSIPEASGDNLVFSPDGSHLYVNSSSSIKIIDPDANRVTLTFPDPLTLVPTLSVSEDGSLLGVSYETPDTVDGFALSQDGAQIITYTIDRSMDSASGAENVRLATWDAKTGKYVSETKFSGDFIRAIKSSPDGSLLAIGNSSTIWLWDTTTWQVTRELTGHINFINDFVFTPDGTKILSAARDGTTRVWSLEE
jgi:COMPASS component SWD3